VSSNSKQSHRFDDSSRADWGINRRFGPAETSMLETNVQKCLPVAIGDHWPRPYVACHGASVLLAAHPAEPPQPANTFQFRIRIRHHAVLGEGFWLEGWVSSLVWTCETRLKSRRHTLGPTSQPSRPARQISGATNFGPLGTQNTSVTKRLFEL
jgi:hypothetical protein